MRSTRFSHIKTPTRRRERAMILNQILLGKLHPGCNYAIAHLLSSARSHATLSNIAQESVTVNLFFLQKRYSEKTAVSAGVSVSAAVSVSAGAAGSLLRDGEVFTPFCVFWSSAI